MSAAADAVLSDCGLYRYELTRSWASGPRVCWIMLNPSTADAEKDDPTIRRCVGFARGWGYPGIVVVNLFAYRATRPADLVDAAHAGVDPVGPLNADRVAVAAKNAGIVLVAWGAHGKVLNRAAKTTQFLGALGIELWSLGKTKAGHPRHPLYVPAATNPEIYRRVFR